ncbi:MlaD family protein [Chitinophagales bacterium]|nr:MlaD family protein [Chitinophagales bacterium]
MKISNEIKVALLAIVASVVLYFGFSFLKGKNLLTSENYFTVVYDRVDGLMAGNRVMLSGVQVGMVDYLELSSDGKNQVEVTLSVQEGINIPKGTICQIEAADLLGEMQVSLLIPNPPGPPAQSGEQLTGKIEAGMFDMVESELLPVKNTVQELAVSMDSLITTINKLVADNRMEDIFDNAESTVSNLNRSSSELKNLLVNERSTITAVLANVKTITEQLTVNSGQIESVLTSAEQAMKNVADLPLSATVEQTQTMLASAQNTLGEATTLLAKMSSSEGTLGALLDDRALYESLNNATASLDTLLTDMEENPKRYVHFSVFGRKDKKNKEKK